MRYAICILAHHKPWLMMSSLISLAMQTERDYDLHIIYIKGDGNCRDRLSYGEYHEITDRTKEYNTMLSPSDERILEILRGTKFDITYHELENDHGLDSGAWYRFISKGAWRDYDYVFFLMEGFLFTSELVIGAVKKFIEDRKPHFIDMGYEKRILPRWVLENYCIRGETPTEMDYFHQQMINKTFSDFRENEKFEKLYQGWFQDKFLRAKSRGGATHYHVPDIIYNGRHKLGLYRTYVETTGKFYFPFQKLIVIYQNRKLRLLPLKDVVTNYLVLDNVVFHQEISPYFFGCGCQHILSNEFLESSGQLLQANNFYKVLDYPFSATALEPIWGMMPAWLGYDKWYFDGVHRPRKNFFTLKMEDNQNGMCHYLNIYYRRKITIKPDNDFVRISKITEKYGYIRDILGEDFFM